MVTTGTASAAVGWSSSQEAVATVTAGGQVTSLSAGTTSITPTSVTDPGKSDTITRTVNPLAVLWTRQFGPAAATPSAATPSAASPRTRTATSSPPASRAGRSRAAAQAAPNAFIRNYSPAGNHRWTLQFGTGNDDDARGVATDRLGNVYAAGTTSSALEGTGASGEDGFIRKHGR